MDVSLQIAMSGFIENILGTSDQTLCAIYFLRVHIMQEAIVYFSFF